jgi:hypothetical protein
VVSTGNPFLTYLWQLDSSTFDHTPDPGQGHFSDKS